MNQNNLKELLDCNPHIMCRISYNPLAMIYLNKLQSVSPFSWAADQFCAHANLIIIIEQSFPQLSWSKTVIACLQQENFCCRWQTHIKPCCWSMRTCLQCNQLANQADQHHPCAVCWYYMEQGKGVSWCCHLPVHGWPSVQKLQLMASTKGFEIFSLHERANRCPFLK